MNIYFLLAWIVLMVLPGIGFAFWGIKTLFDNEYYSRKSTVLIKFQSKRNYIHNRYFVGIKTLVFGLLLIFVPLIVVLVPKKHVEPIVQTSRQETLAIEWRPTSTFPTGDDVNQSYTWYSLQNNEIYCMSKIPEADVSTFVASSLNGYGKDKNHVYWCYQILPKADPATFTVLSKEYAKDSSYVFYAGGSIIAGADAATFTPVKYSSPDAMDPLQTGYGKDMNHVYSQDKIIPSADPATFVLEPVSKDKNWIYLNDTIVGPVSLITDNVEYARALPVDCNPAGTDQVFPQVYPTAFSKDGSIVGYANDSRICVINKKVNTIKNYPYGTDMGVSLSKDGLGILFFKYQKGDGEGEQSCADCGQYSYDLASGKVEKVQ
jgi:hypothetical protein